MAFSIRPRNPCFRIPIRASVCARRRYSRSVKNENPINNPNIIEELKQRKDLNGTTYKVHIDGVDQTDMITEKDPSKHTEIWYFAESALGAVRVGDFKYTFKEQPRGWIGETITRVAPTIVNLRLDPFERTAWNRGNTDSYQYLNGYQYEFWRFILVQQKVEELAKSALEFPPLQAGASFSLSAVKAQIMEAIQIEQGGDYLHTVKGNPKDLHPTLEKLFEKQPFSPSAHAQDPSADTGAQLRADRNPTPRLPGGDA